MATWSSSVQQQQDTQRSGQSRAVVGARQQVKSVCVRERGYLVVVKSGHLEGLAVNGDLQVLERTRNAERRRVEIKAPGLEREQERKLCSIPPID
jgi:hypothetical protein